MSPEPAGQARIGGQLYAWRVDGSGVVVRNGAGELLDPVAASVILALGGHAPSWLGVVEALEAAVAGAPERADEALAAAAAALALEPEEQAWLAATTSDRAVLAALAARGRVEAVTNPRCDRLAWDLLREHRDPEVRELVLTGTALLPAALHDHPDPEARIRVARNPACPRHVLAALANGEAPVRKAVAQNEHADARTLRALAADDDVWVRRAAGANPSCPLPSLRRLLTDRYAEVRVAAVSNPSLRRAEAERRMLFDATPAVHVALAQRGDIRPRALSLLERYARRDPVAQYRLVCSRLAGHPAATAQLRARLARALAHVDALSPHEVSRLDAARVARPAHRPGRVLAVVLAAAVLAAGAVTSLGASSLSEGSRTAGLVEIGASLAAAVAAAVVARSALRRAAPPLGYPPPLLALRLGSLTFATGLPMLAVLAAVALSILGIGLHAPGARWADVAVLAALVGWWAWQGFRRWGDPL